MKAIETRAAPNGEGLAEAAGERAKSYVDAGVNTWNDLSRTALQVGRNADRYVRENPWSVIGAAAGAGIVMGFLLRGRRQG